MKNKREKVVASIGTFDGVHLGHKEVIKTLLEEARKRNLPSLLIAFNNIPKDFILGTKTPYVLPVKEKLRRIKKLGVDILLPLDFTDRIRQMNQWDFLQSLGYDIEHLVIGHDFHFGKNQRSIDIPIPYTRLDTFILQGDIISSTGIRELLANGDIKKAALQMGEEYSLLDIVAHGKKIGRTLGFPTYNIPMEEELALRHGVYASTTTIEDKVLLSITYLGRKPTFQETKLVLETHILNYKEDLYYKEVLTTIKDFVRDDLTFESKEALRSQIEKDIQKCISSKGGDDGKYQDVRENV